MSWDDSSGGDSFVFLGDSSSGSTSAGGAVIALVFIALVIAFLVWLNHKHKADDQRLLSYINVHHCKIDSFMGGDKEKRAVYQCDFGQILDFNLREKALN